LNHHANIGKEILGGELGGGGGGGGGEDLTHFRRAPMRHLVRSPRERLNLRPKERKDPKHINILYKLYEARNKSTYIYKKGKSRLKTLK
jgi:hypothetical protein